MLYILPYTQPPPSLIPSLIPGLPRPGAWKVWAVQTVAIGLRNV